MCIFKPAEGRCHIIARLNLFSSNCQFYILFPLSIKIRLKSLDVFYFYMVNNNSYYQEENINLTTFYNVFLYITDEL